ncbi:MAG: putative transport system ATP-binding protein, partial [Frankiaceae bacterium]|nr:putative transport system ATP-binding protein [Frankiaceae bacterium]
PTAGNVAVWGHRLASMTPRELATLRLREIGVVLQNPGRNLLAYDTAVGNLLFVQRPTRRSGAAKRRRAHTLLESVGLGDAAHRLAGRMSGGEQQRLAVAVALANSPGLLLADEPTSQLDPASAEAVVDLIRSANADSGTTVVAVTHDEAVGAALGRTVTIRDGRVGAEGRSGAGGRVGEEFLVVGRDGSVQLPPDLLDVLPPGTLARAVPHDHGVDLRRVYETTTPEAGSAEGRDER